MLRWSCSPNIYVNGDAYLKGFLGLDWFPSAEAKRHKQLYETWCIGMLNNLIRKYSSYWVLREIFTKWPRYVLLEPLRESDIAPPTDLIITPTKSDLTDFRCKAKVDPQDKVRATKRGEEVGTGNFDTPRHQQQGTGEGSNATLRINPWQYHNVGGSCPNGPGRGVDEIMLHELVHALSSISGKMANTMAGPMDFTNLEEFTAITIANVYSSEIHRPLRKDHNGFEILKPELSNSQAFYNKYSKYMQEICNNHHKLATNLKVATGIAFNPFTLCNL